MLLNDLNICNRHLIVMSKKNAILRKLRKNECLHFIDERCLVSCKEFFSHKSKMQFLNLLRF